MKQIYAGSVGKTNKTTRCSIRPAPELALAFVRFWLKLRAQLPHDVSGCVGRDAAALQRLTPRRALDNNVNTINRKKQFADAKACEKSHYCC